MSIDFKPSHFFYPVDILKLKSFFDRSQWFSPEEHRRYQEDRLNVILSRASRTIPYYREILRDHGYRPHIRWTLQDLKRLPILEKKVLLEQREKFISSAPGGGAGEVFTTGTNGSPMSILMDKHANVLEFVYYWRLWEWAGYRLGNTFAEFSSAYFLKRDSENFHSYQPGYSRLLLNSLKLSRPVFQKHLEAIRKYRPLFLKGCPSAVYCFCAFLREEGVSLSFKAVFSQGEVLEATHRRFISQTLNCKVFDSYGHMERTVGISSCEQGRLHVHSEYGIAEFLPEEHDGLRDGVETRPARLLGTSLYNQATPLLRYDTGDQIETAGKGEDCPCGRRMPVVQKILGRREDVLVAPDGGVISAGFLAFSGIPGVQLAQVVQESFDLIRIRIAAGPGFTEESEAEIRRRLIKFTGPLMKMEFEYLPACELRNGQRKFRMIISKLNPANKDWFSGAGERRSDVTV